MFALGPSTETVAARAAGSGRARTTTARTSEWRSFTSLLRVRGAAHAYQPRAPAARGGTPRGSLERPDDPAFDDVAGRQRGKGQPQGNRPRGPGGDAHFAGVQADPAEEGERRE